MTTITFQGGMLFIPEDTLVVKTSITKETVDFALVGVEGNLIPNIVVGINKPYDEISDDDMVEIKKTACSLDEEYMALLNKELDYISSNGGKQIDKDHWWNIPHFGVFPIPERDNSTNTVYVERQD